MPKKDTDPNVVLLKPGQQFQIEGWDKPQAVDDFGESYIPRADYTKTRQTETDSLKAQQEAFAQERQRTEQMLQQRAQEVAAMQQQAFQAHQQQQPQAVDPMTAAVQKAQAQYGGYASADLVQQLVDNVSQRSQGFEDQMAQRDQQIQFLANQLQNMQGGIQGLTSHTAQTQESAFLDKMRQQYADKLPASMVDTMWSSLEFNEGEDYRTAFPEYVDKAISGLNDFQKETREKAARSQERDLRMPGMGGEASPSGGIDEAVADMSADDIATHFADMQNAEGTA